MVAPGPDEVRQRGAEDSAFSRRSPPPRSCGARAIPSRARAPTSRALRTRPIAQGDHYVVNGQKIWTTNAHWADWIFCLVRTSNEGKRQEGISFLLIDMKSPGIKIDPIYLVDGTRTPMRHEVNQVFFTDVKVPVENRVGEENKGWTYAKYLLEFERGGQAHGPRLRKAFRHLQTLVQDAAGRRRAVVGQRPAGARRWRRWRWRSTPSR